MAKIVGFSKVLSLLRQFLNAKFCFCDLEVIFTEIPLESSNSSELQENFQKKLRDELFSSDAPKFCCNFVRTLHRKLSTDRQEWSEFYCHYVLVWKEIKSNEKNSSFSHSQIFLLNFIWILKCLNLLETTTRHGVYVCGARAGLAVVSTFLICDYCGFRSHTGIFRNLTISKSRFWRQSAIPRGDTGQQFSLFYISRKYCCDDVCIRLDKKASVTDSFV